MNRDDQLRGRPSSRWSVAPTGGAWRVGSAADAAYQSEMFVDAGAHFIALDVNNVVETKGDLMIMADQVAGECSRRRQARS